MKKFLSIMLSVIMLLGVIPLSVSAAKANSVYIGGVLLNDGESAQCVDGNVIKSDTYSEDDGIVFKDSTLTLNGVTVSHGLYNDAALWFSGVLTLVVKGDSVIDSEGVYGINTDRDNDGSSLNVTGNHTLTVNSSDGGEEYVSYGIYMYSENTNYGSVSVNGKTRLIVNTGNGKSTYGFYLMNYLNVQEGATVDVHSSTATLGGSYAVASVYGNIIVDEGAHLFAAAGTGVSNSVGLLTMSNYYSENRGRISISGEAVLQGYTAAIRYRTSPTGSGYSTSPDLPYNECSQMSKNYDGSGELVQYYGTVAYTEDDVQYYYRYIKVSHTKYSVTVEEPESMFAQRSGGKAVQPDLTWYMDDVIYTADDGFYFPSAYSANMSITNSGIKVTRLGPSQIKVSGKPNTDVTVYLPPAKVMPSDYQSYDLWIAGLQVCSDNAEDIFGDGTASFDFATKTLTLNGYAASAVGNDDAVIASYYDDLTIDVRGNNAVVGGAMPYGIYSTGNVTVTGSGNFTVCGGYGTSTMAVKTEGKFTVDENFTGKFIAYGGFSESYSISTAGIQAQEISVKGGFVSVQGDTAGYAGYGMYAERVNIENATVFVTGAYARAYSYGIYSDSINISNSVVFSKAGLLISISSGYYDYKNNTVNDPYRLAFSSAPVLADNMKVARSVGWGGSSFNVDPELAAASAALLVPSDYTELDRSALESLDDGKLDITVNSYSAEASGGYINSPVSELNIADDKDLIVVNMHESNDEYEHGMYLSASDITINGGRMIVAGGASKYDSCYGLYVNGNVTAHGCDMITVSGNSDEYTAGICLNSSNNIYTVDGGSLTALGATSIDDYAMGAYYGKIIADNSASVLAVSGSSLEDYYSLGFSCSVEINGNSDVMGVGNYAEEYSYGIYSDLVSNSGSGIFIGGPALYSSYGIYDDFTCNYGSELVGIGGYGFYDEEYICSYGICCYNSPKITGVVKAVGISDAWAVSGDTKNDIPIWCEIKGYSNTWALGDGVEIPTGGKHSDLHGYNAVTVTALEPPRIYYGVYIKGIEISSVNKDDVLEDGGSVKYDPDTKTVILENANIAGYSGPERRTGIYTNDELNILVKGNNTVTAELEQNTGYGNCIGIEGYSGVNITLENGAVLNTYGADYAPYNSQGIYAYGNIVISGNGTVNAYAGKELQSYSHAICTGNGSGELTLNGNVTLNAYGGEGADGSNGNDYAIYVGNGNINVSGNATINAVSASEKRTSYGFASQGMCGINLKTTDWTGSFVIEGGTMAVYPEKNYAYEYSTIDFPEGSAFVTAFYNNEDKNGTSFSGNSISTSNIYYYKKVAIFNSAKVRFESGFDSDEYMNMLITGSNTLELPECGFNPPAGMEFDCWDYGEVGDSILLGGDMIITAQWWKGFPDVKRGSWFYSAAKYCAKKHFINGYGNGNFGPNDALQRQDFVVILANIAGADLSGYTTCKLTDVDMKAYYGKAVAWAVDHGIIAGYQNGKFGVGDPITREQVATILYRYMGSPKVYHIDGKLAKFPDNVNISEFAKAPLAWAVDKNIITGMQDGSVAPQGTAVRAQIASIIMRMDQAGMFYGT